MNIKSKIYTRKNDSGTHYARIILPNELRDFVSKAGVWRSLSTKEDAEARRLGIVTAVATRQVFQEVSDTYLKEQHVVVVIAAELVGEKIDLEAISGEVAPEDLLPLAESLRASFGISSKGTGSAGKPSDGGSNIPAQSRKSRTRNSDTVAHKKSAAGKPISLIQNEPTPPLDAEVQRYIEKRPHGLYRFRYWIPRPLQKLIGQREVRRTLGTKDREEAITKARPIFKEVREMLSMLHGGCCSA